MDRRRHKIVKAFLGILLWQYHASFMILGIVFLLSGIMIARYFNKKGWWLKAHKYLGLLGLFFSSVGIITAFYMVSGYADTHFRYFHGILGLFTVTLLFMTAVLGYLQFKYTDKIDLIKAVHRWSGRIGFILMLITVYLGLRLVGLV